MIRLSNFIVCTFISTLLCSEVGAQHLTLSGFQKQVQRRVARDQAVRYALIELERNTTGEAYQKKYYRAAKRASDVDEQNVAWLRKQVAQIGMPAPSVLGRECAEGFFLLIIHADRDREFQRECIRLMKQEPDEWPESYVNKLKLRVSLPLPRKLAQLKPDEKKNKTNADQVPTLGDAWRIVLNWPLKQIAPPESAQKCNQSKLKDQ